MGKNIAICVLSKLDPPNARRNTVYQSEDLGDFEGIQSNEAAIKYLLTEALENDRAIDEIVYLRSEECSAKSLPQSCLPDSMKDANDEYLSTDVFFMKQIELFCEKTKMPLPSFHEPISYNPLEPTDSLVHLISLFHEGDCRVSIDTTGGPRDAVILLTLAVEILKMTSSHNEISSIVYAYYERETQTGHIAHQDHTFGLIDLIQAIEAFTEYGRADKLCDFFSDGTAISYETQGLCQSMKAFSDSLALCQVNNIEQVVERIHDCLSAFISAVSQKSSTRQNAKRVLETETDESIIKGLEEQIESNTLTRGELLLAGIALTIKDNFIADTADPNVRVLNTIRWCVEHQMLQQALCIYRERIAECLLNLEYFELADDYPTADSGEDARGEANQIKNILCGCKANKTSGVIPIDNVNYFVVRADKEWALRAIALHYGYLHHARNTVMHINANDRRIHLYWPSCRYLGIDPNGTINIERLKSILIEAVDVIERPLEISKGDWEHACKPQKKKTGKKRQS